MILGIGCDLIEVERISTAIEKGGFVERVYTPMRKNNFVPTNRACLNTKACGRFSAKEALVKALGTGFRQGSFQDIEILDDSLGKPKINLYGQFCKIAESMGVSKMHVSDLESRECMAMAQVFWKNK
jgi:holo-[acyl-carrier protein] synthase